jgi:RNA polymerase sigma-70 factor (ECF subfamily)
MRAPALLRVVTPLPAESPSPPPPPPPHEPARDIAADHARVRRVVREQFGPVWRYLRRMGLAADLAEDGAQQVFVVFARRLPEIAPPAERSFLFATAVRVASDLRKQHNRGSRAREVQDDAQLSAAVAPVAGLDTALDERRARRLLDDLLADLPDELREVLVMCDIEELTMASVAEVLELPAGTVASRLRRARQIFSERVAALRVRLEGGGEKEGGR